MGVCRLTGAFLLLAAPFAVGCTTESVDSGPTRTCVNAAGVWDVTLASESGTGIVCPDAGRTWTLAQSACDVTISAASWDRANGAVGGISDNRLYVEWTWFEDCYVYRESIDVTIDGDAMTGTYYLVRGQHVYPATCPGLGMCSATLTGTRRTP